MKKELSVSLGEIRDKFRLQPKHQPANDGEPEQSIEREQQKESVSGDEESKGEKEEEGARPKSVSLKNQEEKNLLPKKLNLSDLFTYGNFDLAAHLLRTNTFFHGKVGFYEILIRKVFDAAGHSVNTLEYLYTAENLNREILPSPLLILPKVKSEEVLNDFVAKSLRRESNKQSIWLIAHPLSINKHLLLGFHNFFISSNDEDEIKYLQNVFSLDSKNITLTEGNEREAIFITDYQPMVRQAHMPVASIRLDILR